MFWIEEYTETSSGLSSLIRDGRLGADWLPVPGLPRIHTHLVITSHTRAAPAVSFNPHQSRVPPLPIAALSGRRREACEIPLRPNRPISSSASSSERLTVWSAHVRRGSECDGEGSVVLKWVEAFLDLGRKRWVLFLNGKQEAVHREGSHNFLPANKSIFFF